LEEEENGVMSAAPLIGMIVPPAAGEVPPEALQMYPIGVRFTAAGLALGRLTPDGYDAVIDRVESVARELASRGASAVALMGTSLSFYRGSDWNEQLIEIMRRATGLPTTTMSTGVVEALRRLGARRLAVGTAYVDEVNRRLERFLADRGFEVASLEALHIEQVDDIWSVTPDDLIALGNRASAAALNADALFISCGGLRTLDVTVPLERRCGLPVVSSATAGVWAAMRLIGHSGRVPGYGRLLEMDGTADEVGSRVQTR
jgi:arylmalonate decarboxylase